MAGERVRWTNGVYLRDLLRPNRAARLLFAPAWIPEPLDPEMETLRRVRAFVGLLTYCGVYAISRDDIDSDDFSIGRALHGDIVTMLLLVHPVTVCVMLLLWKRRGSPLHGLGAPVVRTFLLLGAYVGAMFILVQLTFAGPDTGASLKGDAIRLIVAFWLFCFVAFASLTVVRNFFGSAAVHPGLPALLASITTWPAVLPSLNTDDVDLGLVLALGGPVTVTAIGFLELSRLRRYHGIELLTHPGVDLG